MLNGATMLEPFVHEYWDYRFPLHLTRPKSCSQGVGGKGAVGVAPRRSMGACDGALTRTQTIRQQRLRRGKLILINGSRHGSFEDPCRAAADRCLPMMKPVSCQDWPSQSGQYPWSSMVWSPCRRSERLIVRTDAATGNRITCLSVTASRKLYY